MKHLVLIVALGLSTHAVAQEQAEDGPSLLERGAQTLLDRFMRDMEPAIEDLSELAQGVSPALLDFVAQMGPALRDILREVEDWSRYEPPEILENGDIIIRRKPRAEGDAPEPGENNEIEI